ncbi:2-isopropylmalate synthase [Streptomyces sp. GbtcB6]|uniref:2-isopropylmalate synthase n=1 Tax=Streptomyces sp. GbtcB6 TaxID=2824751 RepID=UPI001C30F04A|nr:2-isopropylmalate synthase [Streptomyces sp. GbtcB6]
MTLLWNPQRPSPMPYHRYRPFHERVDVPVAERGWPAARIERAPLWVPVDLRDGNQALAEPMDTPRKRRLFDLLVRLGFKEIEVGYPSASRTDFDFVRHLAAGGAVPDDVTPVVFTPARHDLIDRTFEAIEGMPRAVVHLYIATSPVWREVVLRRDRAEVWRTVREAAAHMARRAGDTPGVRFQFSPETYNLTEPDFVLELCDGLTELWDACPDRPVTHNLPATVEIATPNVYADQIEYAHRHLARRDSVILSVHPHNDRGTGVACAELAVLAGAQRVEGCLFGNGERTGNVDLVTLALNLFAQGVDPMVDFGDIDTVRETVEACNRLPVHPRHPYAGELVHTAFSGTHQDAISKGFEEHARRAEELGVPGSQAPWSVPYLPVDPADLGRSYEAVIRVNSQSGKGGSAYLLRTHHGIDLPEGMRPEFARLVQEVTDASGREATPKELYDLFRAAYLSEGAGGEVRLDSWSVHEEAPGRHRFVCTLRTADRTGDHEGTGPGPLTAFADALTGAGHPTRILTVTGSGPYAFAECRVSQANGPATAWGAAEDPSPLAASVGAVLCAVNRAAVR